MKSKFIGFIISLLIGIWSNNVLSSDLTVTQAFLEIPQDLIGYSRDERKFFLNYGKDSSGSVVDERNGYIKYTQSDNPDKFDFVIFKKRDQSYLAAISVDPIRSCADEEEPGNCTTQLEFFHRTTRGWEKLGTSPLPKPFREDLLYRLPRYGKTIVVMTVKGAVVEKYRFDGERFIVAPE